MSADLEHIRQVMREADCLHSEAEVEAAIARVGAQITAVSPEEHELTGVVTVLDETTATVDFNHPLAGRRIQFDVEVLEIDPALEANDANPVS